ncbi:hypothetical protein [Hydrogenophaga sp. IBVHS1]|uniref:hypothetical protein n=1 Tax=unclassified Hydrogenophaga TaxID=2610897 RepID=UPI000A2DD40A|nr:hypothetical protein [Hydrogenophaga sp. IBVHS1]OSZ71220.1 hypothetical protein CAP37_18440 [Hydrogenophaga sp. IBVHS1]
MNNALKFVMWTMVAFSPTIIIFLGAGVGLIDDGESFAALSTGVAFIQAFFIVPYAVWIGGYFKRNPEKYTAPGWLLRILDVLPIGFIVFVILYIRFNGD